MYSAARFEFSDGSWYMALTGEGALVARKYEVQWQIKTAFRE